MSSDKKVILVIGATGAQGSHVIDALLKPTANGMPSPYAVRALTRDPDGKRAKDLAGKGVELYKGSFMDFDAVLAALEGAYGAYVNTDAFTVGEMKEMYAGMRIFELAKQIGTLRHYVWSSTPHSLRLGGYDPKYNVAHNNSKARVAEWMKAQPSEDSEDGLVWTTLTMGIYMDMIKLYMIGPVNIRPDGTRVFANPLSEGPIALIALEDLGFWARYTFDNRTLSSAKDFNIASDWVSYRTLPEIFTKVTGFPAVYRPTGIDEWFGYLMGNLDRPLANERLVLDGKEDVTWRQNFTCWWHAWRDSAKLWPIDMEWIRSIHPESLTVEGYIRKSGWDGKIDVTVLKNAEDGKGVGLDSEKVKAL